MDEGPVDALFARYVEHLVVKGTQLDLEELAEGDAEVTAALRERVLAFRKIDDALGRELQPLSGRTLGRYEVREKLGAGGMGEVYRALDKDLDREVAVKVLPPLLAWNPERRTRFEREARILAALDHRNIAAIHGLERSDGLLFLALELVPGETLEERVRRGPLGVEEALLLFRQIAGALEAAHAKGIAHRDLKPANVKVTPEGVVKLLDFGLGKTFDPHASVDAESSEEEPAPDKVARSLELAARTFGQTVTGLVLGTAAYMSPEQALGKGVDHRTDIFSFGVLFHEMLTGKNPFTRGTWAETRAAILGEPATRLSALRSDIAADAGTRLERVLDRCLAKDPADRYPTAAALRADLDEIGGASPAAGEAAATARRKRLLLATSGTAALLAGAFAYRRVSLPEPLPVLSNPVQVTRTIGAEQYPSWSPDGGRIAYHLNTQGHEKASDIWVAELNTGQAVNLTSGHLGSDLFPSFSQDGSQIASWSDREGGGYFLMPAQGGPAREVMSEHLNGWWDATRPEWSRDGRELSCVARERGGGVIRTLSLGSGQWRQLPLPGAEGARLDVSGSPDGRYFAYVVAGNRTSQVTELRVLRVEDRRSFSVTDGRTEAWSPSWSSDGRHLYFVSNRRGSKDLWRQRLRDGRPDGEPERVTVGVGMTSAAFSPDSRKLAYSSGRAVSNVWRVPISRKRPATWADARQLTFDDAYIEMLDVSPDGERLLISSDRAGNPDLWVLPTTGGEMQQLTTDPTPDWAPAWSPDGQEIAFSAYRSGSRQIWVQSVAGGPARQVTSGESPKSWPSWSPDGRRILFTLDSGGNTEYWTVPAAGGEARLLMTDPGNYDDPRWSPDGKWLAFLSRGSGSFARPWRARADGGNPEPLRGASGESYALCWSPDSRSTYYLRVGEQATNVWTIGVDGRVERPLTDLRGRRGGPDPMQRALATDGSYLYFIWREELGDIWVADVAYPGRWD